MADEETNGAATILAMHTTVAWLAGREMRRDPEARDALLAFAEGRMLSLMRAHPDLAGAAEAACGVVARVADGDEPRRLHG